MGCRSYEIAYNMMARILIWRAIAAGNGNPETKEKAFWNGWATKSQSDYDQRSWYDAYNIYMVNDSNINSWMNTMLPNTNQVRNKVGRGAHSGLHLLSAPGFVDMKDEYINNHGALCFEDIYN